MIDAPETGRWHLRLEICRCRHGTAAYRERLFLPLYGTSR
jgi:hypothetical protein